MEVAVSGDEEVDTFAESFRNGLGFCGASGVGEDKFVMVEWSALKQAS